MLEREVVSKSLNRGHDLVPKSSIEFSRSSLYTYDPRGEEADIWSLWVQEGWIGKHSVKQINVATAVTCERNIGDAQMGEQ